MLLTGQIRVSVTATSRLAESLLLMFNRYR
jgi:hypothetical protein